MIAEVQPVAGERQVAALQMLKRDHMTALHTFGSDGVSTALVETLQKQHKFICIYAHIGQNEHKNWKDFPFHLRR